MIKIALMRLLRALRGPANAEPASQTLQIFPNADADIDTRVPFDEYLLERARLQWHLGDWDGLAAIERSMIQQHPERAKLALLVGAALQQAGEEAKAASFIRTARDWGCSKRLVAQILIAGVHNSLARAAIISGAHEQAEEHFRLAVTSGSPGIDLPLLAQMRALKEMQRMGLINALPTSVQQLGTSTEVPTTIPEA